MATTYLFVPAHDARKVARALGSGSGAVILDLEDAVPEEEKERARQAVAELLARQRLPLGFGGLSTGQQALSGGEGQMAVDSPRTSPAETVQRTTELWIRVNGFQGPYFAEDVASVDWSRATGAVIPKAEDPSAVAALEAAGVRRILLLIESVAGFAALPSMVGVGSRVERIAVGTWDLALDLGLVAVDDPDESDLIWQMRGHAVIESRRLGLRPPIDGIYARFQDDNGLREACRRALRIGFGGKLLIHPRQIAVAQSVFTPDTAAVESAHEVVAAYKKALREGRGAVQVRGQAVDKPVVERALALLARWEDSAGGGNAR